MDVWRNAKHIEELREEVKDLRRLILRTVEYMKEKKASPPAPVKAKPEEGKKKKSNWF